MEYWLFIAGVMLFVGGVCLWAISKENKKNNL